MIKEKSSEGFSSYVCLVLLVCNSVTYYFLVIVKIVDRNWFIQVANILRICFFYGKRFGLELLFQSIFMIIVQIGMLYIWFLFRSRRDRSVKSEFWNWDSFIMYCMLISLFPLFQCFLFLLIVILDSTLYWRICCYFWCSYIIIKWTFNICGVCWYNIFTCWLSSWNSSSYC